MQKFKHNSDRTSSASNQIPAMVKIEYPSAAQSEQHTDIAQDPYHNQIGSLSQNYSSINYSQTQYGTEPLNNHTISIDSDCEFHIAEKPMIGHQSPVVPSIQALPEVLHRDAIITSTQSHIQNQLQRKHEELQKLIMKQQEELQLVSEQLHLAQRGMLPVVSSTQVESQLGNSAQVRLHAHEVDKMGNNVSAHRLRLTENASQLNCNEQQQQQQSYMEQPVIQPICHANDIPSSASILVGKPDAVDQMPQVHSSQDFQTSSKPLANYEDSNPTSISPATPASITSTIGTIKYTPNSD